MSEFTPHTPGPESVAITPQQIAAADEAPFEITEDTVCVSCEYNLRGLGSDSRCPECGTSIGRSLRGDLLRFADPNYVRKLAGGIRLVLWSITISILLAIGLMAYGIANGPAALASMTLAMFALNCLTACGILAGAWLVTTPDPNKIDADKTFTARKIIRLFVLCQLPCNLFNIVWTLATGAAPAPSFSTGAGVILLILTIPYVVLSVIHYFAHFTYFRSMARRIPDPTLEKNTHHLMWGGVFVGGLMIVMFVLTVVTAATAKPSANPGPGSIVFSCAGSVGSLICFFWWVRVMRKYRNHFAAQAVLAEETWAQNMSAPLA